VLSPSNRKTTAASYVDGMGLTCAKPWMTRVLWAAGLYHMAWGALVVFIPGAVSGWLGLGRLAYPEVWQYVGLLVGLLGIAFIAAASSPFRHWPVVLAGLLAQLLGTAGFASAALRHQLPWQFGWTILGNNLLWVGPFAFILAGAYQSHMAARRAASSDVEEFALRVKTNTGISLLELSKRQPVLLVFLRHTGCPFCRETLSNIAQEKQKLEAGGNQLVFVHMGSEQHAKRTFSKYALQDVPRVSDPKRTLYRAFGLGRGGPWQILGPPIWWRAVVANLRYGQSLVEPGDYFQMPGMFLVFHGHIVRSFLHQTVADRPDYLSFVRMTGATGSEALG
jgi:peroxiredoxin